MSEPIINDGGLCAGMSLRDYFAAEALSGWLANPAPSDRGLKHSSEIADWAYEMADAMIAARDNKSKAPAIDPYR